MTDARDDTLGELLDGNFPTGHEELPEDAGDAVFVDGVLRELLAPRDVAGQVDRAMARIDAERRVPHVRRAVWSLAAAVVAVALVVWFTGSSRDPLLADVQKVIAASDRSVDRTYRVTVTGDDGVERPSRLYVRGSEKFAVRAEVPSGELWFGFDGKQGWLVPARPRLPVFIGPSFEDTLDWNRMTRPRMPFMRFVRLLRRLARGYELSVERTETDVNIVAVRRPQLAETFPERVRVVAIRASSVVRRLEMDWSEGRRARAPRRMVLDLDDQTAQPDAVYRHEGHHAPGREVRHIDRKLRIPRKR